MCVVLAAVFVAAVFVFAASVITAAPASALTYRSGPVEVFFGNHEGSGSDPFSEGPGFDAGLGTLNAVTLSFTGSVGFRWGDLVENRPPYPRTITAPPRPFYSNFGFATEVQLAPITAPLDVEASDWQLAWATAYASAPASFDLKIPGSEYGSEPWEGQVTIYSVFSMDGIEVYWVSSINDTAFSGTVSALFE